MRRNPLCFFWADLRRRLPYRRYLDVPDRSRRLWALGLSLLTLLLGFAYLVWLGRLVFQNRELQDFCFLGAELLSFLLLLLLGLNVWHLRGHRAEGLSARQLRTVDVFLPCCGEPLEVIRTTLRAVKRVAYAGLQVLVLDDGASPQVEALAQSLGFRYLSRPGAGLECRDSKSGNLNYGLKHSQGELILVLDADQVPVPEIATRLAGFFELPQVAYVQSKQTFFLPEGDPFYNADQIFYETLQLSNDQANAVISCGSGVMYRRQALEELGGFVTWNIVEDCTTSYDLLSRGWKGVYYPYPLSRGLAPATLIGVYRQRFQWCLDAMRLFFWDNPLFKAGLCWRQKSHFLIVMLSYLASGLVFPIFYAIPLYIYCFGKSMLLGHEGGYLLLRSAYLAATILMFRFLFFRQQALKQLKIFCGLFPVHALAILTALAYPPGRKPAYQVNNLAPFAEDRCGWQLAPHLGLIGLHLTLPLISLWQGWALPQLVLCNSFFSAFIIWVMADLVLGVLSGPRWSPAMDPRQVYG
jgi:cellulose synthase (UDP-forming)